MKTILKFTDTGDDLIRMSLDEEKQEITLKVNIDLQMTTLANRDEFVQGLQTTLDYEVERLLRMQAAGEKEILTPEDV